MTIDMSRPDPELVELVATRCAQFGSVRNVGIFRTMKPRFGIYATVEMSSRGEAIELFNAHGTTDFGCVVMITLDPAEQWMPALLNGR